VVCARSPPPCLLVGALRQSLAMDMTPTDLDISVRPANEAPWEDVERVLGKARCHGALCYCQRFKMGWSAWRATTDEERAYRLREQTDCGHPESGSTSGLLAYADGEPVGWCNVEPRTAFPYIPDARIAWKKRGEDKEDDSVRAAACFVTRTEFQHSGVSRALAAAAVDFARERGARALEGYAMITEPGREITWGELHVGSRSIFAAAGFREVARPTLRRVVMRIDF
jgi:GNAT superfamily N-acetyltransferase